ncbi:MAG: hypothetical protein EBY43_09925, partial [Opitutae bacterium]|nr:hypothetical protein [Opitutae bacterium]
MSYFTQNAVKHISGTRLKLLRRRLAKLYGMDRADRLLDRMYQMIGRYGVGVGLSSGSNLFAVDTNGVGIGTSANLYKLNVRGNTNISGTLYAGYFAGDGSGITNLNAAALGWTQVTNGIYNSSLTRVGLGTTNPRFITEIGPVGTADTT